MCAVLFTHGMLIILAASQTFVLSSELYTLTLFRLPVHIVDQNEAFLQVTKTDL